MPDDVHPQIQAMIDRTKELGIPKIQDLSTAEARALVEALAAARLKDYPAPEVAEVENTSTGPGFGHVPLRIYRTREERAAPAILFYHGGGHVFGSLDTHDTAARFLARETGCTLISVDYRMGPEHPFPAAVEDCEFAVRWRMPLTPCAGFPRGRRAWAWMRTGSLFAGTVRGATWPP